MQTSKLVLIGLLIAGIIFSLYYVSKCPNKEGYGGNQSTCEGQCFNSQFYDACMHVCMEGSSADFTGRADEYAIPTIGAGIPLEDDEANQGYLSTVAGPYRYEVPGH